MTRLSIRDISSTELTPTQAEVEVLSTNIENLVSQLVRTYTKDLDNYIKEIKEILDEYSPTNEELVEWVGRLPIFIYYASSALEDLSIRENIAEMLKDEKYSDTFSKLTEGTVKDKESQSHLETIKEEMVENIYKSATRKVKNKIEYSTKLLDSIKKIMGLRMSEMELTRKER